MPKYILFLKSVKMYLIFFEYLLLLTHFFCFFESKNVRFLCENILNMHFWELCIMLLIREIPLAFLDKKKMSIKGCDVQKFRTIFLSV